MKTKKISDTVWLFTSDTGQMVSVVMQTADNTFSSTHNEHKQFTSLDEIAADFGEKISKKKK